MKKEELAATLTEIQARLNSLGDLSVLIAQGNSLPELVQKVQAAQTSVQELLPQLTTQKDSTAELLKEIQILKEELTTKNEEVEELTQKTQELQEKTDSLKQQTLEQLGLAASEKLSNSFEQVKVELHQEKISWFGRLSLGVVALVLATAAIAVWQVKDTGTLYELTFLIKIALTSPIVYFIVFTNREYGRVRNLIEEYTFKAAIARSFEAYKEILEEAFADQQESVYQKKLDFILGAVTSLYSSPMKNIKSNSTKESEISPDILLKLKDIFLTGQTPNSAK